MTIMMTIIVKVIIILIIITKTNKYGQGKENITDNYLGLKAATATKCPQHKPIPNHWK